jgi:hypothetical protein
MKNLVFIFILNAMCLNLVSQNRVYNSEGEKVPFKLEDIDILFQVPKEDAVKIERIESGGLIGMLPTVVNMAFQLTTNILEKRTKKFTAEYTKTQSYLDAGSGNIPNITFVHKIGFNGDQSPNNSALSIEIIAYQLDKLRGFVYYIKSIELNYSLAKGKRFKHNTFDYSIEIKPTFLINNEKKRIDISPIAVSSVEFKKNEYEDKKHRTDIIPMPKEAILTEISLKIVESNPIKVRAEKVLSAWNTYKDSTKTIINNYLPKDSPKGSEGKEDETIDNTTDPSKVNGSIGGVKK